MEIDSELDSKLESEEFVNGGFDFKSFRVKSLETYFNEYYENRNLNNYDHWIYGYCKNETDIVWIDNLIEDENFYKSAYIRKYFSFKEQKYYDTEDSLFRWRVMTHGVFNSDNKILYYYFGKMWRRSITFNKKGRKKPL